MQERKLVGEIEVAWQATKAPMIAITGTNGKSTVTTWLGKMMGEEGLVAGNIGTALVQVILEGIQDRWLVAEISSFQLCTIHDFAPRYAVLTNITGDHLDYHQDIPEYVAAKARIFENMGSDGEAWVNYDDPLARKLALEIQKGEFADWPGRKKKIVPPSIYFYSSQQALEKGVWWDSQKLSFWLKEEGQESRRLARWDDPSKVPHTLNNATVVVALAARMGRSQNEIEALLGEVPSLHFRMERAPDVGGVCFINDSKATNVASACSAVASLSKGDCVIVGGKDKGTDFDPLIQKIAEKKVSAILIGESAGRLEDTLKKYQYYAYKRSESLEGAVRLAFSEARMGQTILLSPACSSFDMFRSAEHRGEEFFRIVEHLRQEG